MNSLSFTRSPALLAISLIVTALGATFTYLVLDPTIGFDDANITQVYGRHLAQGHGYVYNIGGERVEGSTSLLWTFLNAAAFVISDQPEGILGGVCFVLTALTVFCASRIAAMILQPGQNLAPLATAAAFLVFPAFFGWMVWSLMDMALWVFMITVFVFLLLRTLRAAQEDRFCLFGLIITAGMLPLTRPEGIIVPIGMAAILILRGLLIKDRSVRIALAVGVGAVVSFVGATVWRISYFGYPFPNTYYAKTSSDTVAQFIRGIRYILSYVEVPQHALLICLICAAAALIVAKGSSLARTTVLVVAALLTGAVVVYAVLGGDHFGSHRFFLFFVPLGLPMITAGLGMIPNAMIHAQPWQAKVIAILLIAPMLIVGVVGARNFTQDKGNIDNEFRIAEDGRKRGTILNSLPGDPVLGVVAAGGTRMGYDGRVQDLLGLNWTRVAHAEPDGDIAPIPNHTAFNQDVFWDSPPDIFVARTAPCPDSWTPLVGFMDDVTDNISAMPRFKETYELACFNGLVFHVSKTYLDRLELDQVTVPFQILPASR